MDLSINLIQLTQAEDLPESLQDTASIELRPNIYRALTLVGVNFDFVFPAEPDYLTWWIQIQPGRSSLKLILPKYFGRLCRY